MKIAVFYHVYTVNNWKEIFTEQFNLMIKSGLISGADEVFINVGTDNNAYNYICEVAKNFINIKVSFYSENLFEYPTLKLLQDYCKDNDCYVLYCHTKGVANQIDLEKQIAWRQSMNNICIQKWNDCIKKLDEKFDCCGVNWWAGFAKPHFSGNFWWANSNYINKLPKLELPIEDLMSCGDLLKDQRIKYEFWIGTGKPNVYNFEQQKY